MGQITATLGKTIKEFLRQKTILFWTIAWPILWVLIGSFSFARARIALASLLYSIVIILNQNYPNYLGLMAFVLLAISVASFATSLSAPSLGAFLQKISAYGYFIWTLIPTYLLWSSIRSSNSR